MAPCPRCLGYVYLAERFGKWPWEMEGYPPDYIPADRREYYLQVLSAEAEYKALISGTSPGEEIIEIE